MADIWAAVALAGLTARSKWPQQFSTTFAAALQLNPAGQFSANGSVGSAVSEYAYGSGCVQSIGAPHPAHGVTIEDTNEVSLKMNDWVAVANVVSLVVDILGGPKVVSLPIVMDIADTNVVSLEMVLDNVLITQTSFSRYRKFGSHDFLSRF